MKNLSPDNAYSAERLAERCARAEIEVDRLRARVAELEGAVRPAMNKSDLIKWLRNEAGSINPDPAALTSAIAEIESLRTQVASLELKLKLAVRSPAEDLIEAELKRERAEDGMSERDIVERLGHINDGRCVEAAGEITTLRAALAARDARVAELEGAARRLAARADAVVITDVAGNSFRKVFALDLDALGAVLQSVAEPGRAETKDVIEPGVTVTTRYFGGYEAVRIEGVEHCYSVSRFGGQVTDLLPKSQIEKVKGRPDVEPAPATEGE